MSSSRVILSQKYHFSCIFRLTFFHSTTFSQRSISLCISPSFPVIDCRSIVGTVFRRCKLLLCGLCAQKCIAIGKARSQLCLQKQFQCSNPSTINFYYLRLCKCSIRFFFSFAMRSLARSFDFGALREVVINFRANNHSDSRTFLLSTCAMSVRGLLMNADTLMSRIKWQLQVFAVVQMSPHRLIVDGNFEFRQNSM